MNADISFKIETFVSRRLDQNTADDDGSIGEDEG